MNLALDYDDTYTRDPVVWNQVIQQFHSAGHKVYLVTLRDGDNYKEVKQVAVALRGVPVYGYYFTNGKAKKTYMYSKGIRIDVWIDDSPQFILQDKEAAKTHSFNGHPVTKEEFDAAVQEEYECDMDRT